MAVHNLVKSVDIANQPGAPWTATATVVYMLGDGQDDIVESYKVDPPIPQALTPRVIYRQTQLTQNVVDPAGLKALLSLQGTEILPEVEVVVIPDPVDVARNKFLNLWTGLKRAREKLAAGVIDESNALYVQLLADTIEAFKDGPPDCLTLG